MKKTFIILGLILLSCVTFSAVCNQYAKNTANYVPYCRGEVYNSTRVNYSVGFASVCDSGGKTKCTNGTTMQTETYTFYRGNVTCSGGTIVPGLLKPESYQIDRATSTVWGCE